MRVARLLALLVLSFSIARADVSATLPRPPTDEAARALVQRWLDAQNRGDFAAYQALYATAFTGVRRSGARMVTLDRAGWMAERARMFKKKMGVSAADVRVGVWPSATVVTFVQTWSSGSFSDTGGKRLRIVDEAGAARIAREEMLESRVANTEGPPLTDGEVEELRCLYHDIDARWRRVDGGRVVKAVRSTRHGNAWVMWVEMASGPGALAICKGPKSLARNDEVELRASRSPGVVASFELRGNDLELRGNPRAFAIEGHLETKDDDHDGEEGCETSVDGSELQLFAVIDGKIVEVYSGTRAWHTSGVPVGNDVDCTVTTGKKAPSGYWDLVERCEETERAFSGEPVAGETHKTRRAWRFSDGEYRLLP